MDRVFSVEDITDHFWGSPPSPPPEIHSTTTNHHQPISYEVKMDREDYQEFLRNKLDLACKAVAITRQASGLRPQESAAVAPDIMSQLANSVQIMSQPSPTGSGTDLPMTQIKDDGEPSGKPSLPGVKKKSCVQVRSITSWSSGDQSDDDDEADGETTENMDPVDAKRMRRKLSNRISAQRSRKRKQNHQTELETQIYRVFPVHTYNVLDCPIPLKDFHDVGVSLYEHSLLLKRLSVSSQNYNDAAVDNRVLKADVETLRAKVKMAEETVKRITGFNPFLQSMSDISMSVLPAYAGGSPGASTDAAVPLQDNPKQQYYMPPSNNHMHSHNPGIPNRLVNIAQEENIQHPTMESAAVAGANKVAITSSMRCMASLEHLQKCIQGAGENQEDESCN
ncbi:basic leucine zipper transcription factor [Lithospermum erythrorhizon]|uniref:Basic leucine zipper transcription factor n=1 Tax=Lithospermum erythrorhizon TaxID=34254 RepID=A0AAV3PX80_LITER